MNSLQSIPWLHSGKKILLIRCKQVLSSLNYLHDKVTNYEFLGYPPYPSSNAGYPPAYPTVASYPSASSNATPYPPYPSSGYPPYPIAATAGGSGPSYPPYSVNPTVPSSTGTISEDHIRASLLSAVEDKVYSYDFIIGFIAI